MKPTIERIRELVRYDRETGELINLVARGGLEVGRVAGGIGPNGYVYVSLDRWRALAHRVAWAIETGAWPPRLDHRDLCRANNRWLNLRLATRSQNGANTGRRKHSLQAAKGVERHGNVWRARITVKGVRRTIGTFETADAAARAYLDAAAVAFGPFARAA